MFWKQFSFDSRRYALLIIGIVVALMFLGRMAGSTPVQQDFHEFSLAVEEPDTQAQEFIRENLPGSEMVFLASFDDESPDFKDTDAFVSTSGNDEAVRVVINPFSSNAEILELIINQLSITTEYRPVVKDAPEHESSVHVQVFLILYAVAVMLIAYSSVLDEKNMLTALLCSPMRDSDIVIAKLCMVWFFALILCCFECFLYGTDLRVAVLLLLLGGVYGLIGILFGVLKGQKMATAIFWGILIVISMAQIAAGHVVNVDSLISMFGVSLIALIMVAGVLLVLTLKVFSWRINRLRTGK